MEAAAAAAETGKATSEEARAAVEAELTRVQGHVLLDRTLSSDMQIALLNTELQRLQPYGAPAAASSNSVGRAATTQRPTTAARFEETAKAQVRRFDGGIVSVLLCSVWRVACCVCSNSSTAKLVRSKCGVWQ